MHGVKYPLTSSALKHPPTTNPLTCTARIALAPAASGQSCRRKAESPEPRCTHLPKMDLTLACSAFPCAVLPPTGQNPLMPKSFLAFLVASAKALNAGFMLFLARTDAALLTILPSLFLTKVAFVRPPDVFSFKPRKTWALPNLPLAILLTARFIAFIAFIAAFIPFTLFIAVFIAAFMAFGAFIAFFIARAMAERALGGGFV